MKMKSILEKGYGNNISIPFSTVNVILNRSVTPYIIWSAVVVHFGSSLIKSLSIFKGIAQRFF